MLRPRTETRFPPVSLFMGKSTIWSRRIPIASMRAISSVIWQVNRMPPSSSFTVNTSSEEARSPVSGRKNSLVFSSISIRSDCSRPPKWLSRSTITIL